MTNNKNIKEAAWAIYYALMHFSSFKYNIYSVRRCEKSKYIYERREKSKYLELAQFDYKMYSYSIKNAYSILGESYKNKIKEIMIKYKYNAYSPTIEYLVELLEK